jgi:hypothetical protein
MPCVCAFVFVPKQMSVVRTKMEMIFFLAIAINYKADTIYAINAANSEKVTLTKY